MALKFTNLLAIIRKPAFGLIPLFPANTDLSWIPDTTNQNIVTQFSAEAPTGIIVTPNIFTYTFASAPKALIWNGQFLRPGSDFTGTNAVTMSTAPAVGDELYAIV